RTDRGDVRAVLFVGVARARVHRGIGAGARHAVGEDGDHDDRQHHHHQENNPDPHHRYRYTERATKGSLSGSRRSSTAVGHCFLRLSGSKKLRVDLVSRTTGFRLLDEAGAARPTRRVPTAPAAFRSRRASMWIAPPTATLAALRFPRTLRRAAATSTIR